MKGIKKLSQLGMLPRLLIGVFIPVLIIFIILLSMLLVSWNLGRSRLTSIKDIGSDSLKELTIIFLRESKSSLDKFGERMIQEKAIDVASQVEIYIKSHQRFKKEDLVKDPWFKAIAIQKVGETGYTSVHDDKGVSYSNITPQIVGRNLRQFYEKSPVFWKILEASLKGPASGYYDWKDADGRTRLKYIFLAPVKDTDLIVASTTYIDEFSKPVMGIGMRMNQIEKKYLDEFDKRLQTFYIVMMIGSIVLFLAIYLFSRSVIHPLRSLSEVADRISMGELDVPIPTATGEVGVLAKSIERMQTSVKVAIERLQRRREQK